MRYTSWTHMWKYSIAESFNLRPPLPSDFLRFHPISDTIVTYLQVPPFWQTLVCRSLHRGPWPQSLPLKPGKQEQPYELQRRSERMEDVSTFRVLFAIWKGWMVELFVRNCKLGTRRSKWTSYHSAGRRIRIYLDPRLRLTHKTFIGPTWWGSFFFLFFFSFKYVPKLNL